MEELRVMKKRLVADLDKNEAPGNWRFEVDRFVRFSDGREVVVPDAIPATLEEVQAHIGVAFDARDRDIEGDRAERDALKEERDAHKEKAEARKVLLEDLGSKVAAALAE